MSENEKKKVGRKSLDPSGEDSVIISFRMTKAQRDQVRELGGSEWIRQMLDLVAKRNKVGQGPAGE